MEQKKKVNEVDKGAIDAAVQQALDSDIPVPKARPTKVPRPKPRPTTRIGGMPGGSTRGIDPRDNYSPEDLKRLLMQSAMERMETEGKSLASLRNRSSFNAQARLKDKNKSPAPKVVKPAQLDLFNDSVQNEGVAHFHDEYDTKAKVEVTDDKLLYDGNDIEMYSWSTAKGMLTPEMYAKARSWDDVHAYLKSEEAKGNLQQAIANAFETNDEGITVEGYYVMPDIDKERYTPMDGLEGPFQTKAGKPIYYDPKEGAYYDRDTDMYLTYSEFKALDEGYSPGDENEEGMVSNCCGAPIMDVYDGHGRCSDCKEMASAVSEAQLRELSDEDRKEYYRSIKKSPGYKPIGGREGEWGQGTNDPLSRAEYQNLMKSKNLNDPLSRAEYQNLMKRKNLMQDDVTVRRDGKTLSKAEIAKLQRQGVLMKEGEDKPYICVHAKKGKHECHAESSYAAAKKAAKHWGLKSTSGIDAHLAESMPMQPLSQPKRVSMTNKQNFRKNFSKRYIDMYPATSEGHSPHKKGTKKYKAHMAAMHANSVDLNAMRDALKLDESANANTVIAEYTRATLDHSYKTWKQVDEQIEFIRSFVKEDVDVNAVAVMLRKMHERENLDQSMQVKENINKLRQIVKENNTMKVMFNDGDMNVDATTAKVFLEVYNKQKSQKQNQIVEKIQTKSGFLSMLEMMYKKIG